MKLHFIQPQKPRQNAFVESFNGKIRDYYLDPRWFASIEDSRSTIDNWERYYNHVIELSAELVSRGHFYRSQSRLHPRQRCMPSQEPGGFADLPHPYRGELMEEMHAVILRQSGCAVWQN